MTVPALLCTQWAGLAWHELEARLQVVLEGPAMPRSTHIMPYNNPEMDRLLEAAEATFDPQEQDRLLARAHETIVEDAPWVFIVHDLNPRAMSPKVKGFVQAQSWFQDLSPMWVEQ